MRGIIHKGIRLLFLALLCIGSYVAYERFSEPMVPELDPKSVPFARDILFGTVIDAASWEMGKKDEAAIEAEGARQEIDLGVKLGAQAVRLNLEKRLLEDAGELKKLDQVVQVLREKKMKVILAYEGRRSDLDADVGKGGASWEEFQKGYKEDALFLMRRYRPDYLLILPGCPSRIGRQVDSSKTAREWFEYAKEVGVAAKQVNFSTNIMLESVFFPEGGKAADIMFAETALGSNDISINAFSLSAGNIRQLEKGTEKFLALQKKYHWEGEMWMGDTKADFATDAAGQEDYLLYALSLASSHRFSGVILGRLTDDARDQSGILGADRAPKEVYGAIQEVMRKRERLLPTD